MEDFLENGMIALGILMFSVFGIISINMWSLELLVLSCMGLYGWFQVVIYKKKLRKALNEKDSRNERDE